MFIHKRTFSNIFPDELNGVNIGMTLTKSTKIRIAILKGLAKIVNNNTDNAVNAYCLEFNPTFDRSLDPNFLQVYT